MDIAVLTTELLTDPLPLGYSGKTSQQVADLLNAPRDTGATELRSLTATEIINTIPAAAFEILLANKDSNNADTKGKARRAYAFLELAGDDEVDISEGSPFRVAALAAGLTAQMGLDLLALATSPIILSRAAELGLGEVGAGHVESCPGTEWEVL